MSVYDIVKILIESKRKSKEELLIYCEAYYATGKLSDCEYAELAKEIASK